jgi:hypothetical protein
MTQICPRFTQCTLRELHRAWVEHLPFFACEQKTLKFFLKYVAMG